MHIRDELPADYAAVYAVNAAAFDTPAEARLVEVLRIEASPVISLVADAGGEVVGHILFSPAIIPRHPERKIWGLAPVAVLPAYQRRCIGSELVKAGLEKCRATGYGAVIVLGHANYYPRFGFTPAAQYGIHSEYDVPEEAFMLLELEPGYLDGVTGVIHYHPAFNAL